MHSSPWKITLSDISISKAEEKAVINVLNSKWFTMGENTENFENEFKRFHQVKYAYAVSNCTAALHLANIALGLGEGDEVICPSLTFVATVNSVLYTGAKPVFADITSDRNLNISSVDIKSKINKKTKAIIIMHYAGYPCDMEAIMAIARKNDLFVIEDCAHAPMVKYKSKYLGTYGDVGCFSFFSNKNITTAEGGMCISNDEKIAAKIKILRSHGMTSLTLDRFKGHSYSYDVVDLGFNFRIDEIRSAIGLVQLSKLSGFNLKRRELVSYYLNKLAEITEITLPFSGFNLEESACHIFPIIVKNNKDRNGLQVFLKDQGIQTSIHYPPVHRFTYYKKRFGDIRLPITEDVASRILTLPLYPALKKFQIDYIFEKIKEYYL